MKDRAIYETNSFWFIQDLHPVCREHYLIVSKKHVVSMAALGVEGFNALFEFVKQCSENLGLSKEQMHLFERGNKEENRTDIPSIDHAHVHVFWGKYKIASNLPSAKGLCSIEKLISIVKAQSYFFYCDCKTWNMKYGDSKDIRSQFIRQCVGRQSNCAHWDWREQNISTGSCY